MFRVNKQKLLLLLHNLSVSRSLVSVTIWKGTNQKGKEVGKEKKIKSPFRAKKNRLLPTRLAVDFCETKNKRAVEERVHYNITGKVIVLMRISFPCAKEVNLKGTTTDTTTSTPFYGFYITFVGFPAAATLAERTIPCGT